jgi:hypothetical protein
VYDKKPKRQGFYRAWVDIEIERTQAIEDDYNSGIISGKKRKKFEHTGAGKVRALLLEEKSVYD